MTDYTQYKDFATARQLEYIEEWEKTKSFSKVGKTFGVTHSTVRNALERVVQKASKRGFNHELGINRPAPTGFEVSTYRVDKEGNYTPAYAKPDKQTQLAETMEYLNDIAQDFKPFKPKKFNKKVKDDLLNLYTITDLHIGQLSWAKEAGNDWDLNICKELVLQAFHEMIESSPAASSCFINQLGDFLHIDSYLPVTPTSGHIVDADSRYPKMVNVAMDIMMEIIEMALKKHKKITVLCAEGNHDMSATPWLQVALNAIYRNEPRVEVMIDPKVYYHYVFGKNMLCFHHGHKRKKSSELHKIFSSDPFFRKDWGRTEYAYCHTGHLHFEKEDDNGLLCVQHPTISSRSAYESRGGWSSMRGCIAFTYHKDYGERWSTHVRPEMFTDLVKGT